MVQPVVQMLEVMRSRLKALSARRAFQSVVPPGAMLLAYLR
jgi:hypothetical protein